MDKIKEPQVDFNEDFMRTIAFLERFVTITKEWNKLVRGEIDVEKLKKTIEELYEHKEKIVKKVKKPSIVKKKSTSRGKRAK